MSPGLCMLAALALVGAEEALTEMPPPPALLDYLGSFEDEAGQWLDPMELDAPLEMIDDAALNKDDDEDEETSDADNPADLDDVRPRGGN